MTEAYAIKGPDGIIRRTIADSSRDAWMLYLGGPKEMHRQVTAELAGLRCVPVAVSEKGEAETLLKYLLDRYDSGQSWDWADWNRVRDYLSRGQG